MITQTLKTNNKQMMMLKIKPKKSKSKMMTKKSKSKMMTKKRVKNKVIQ